MAQIGGRPMRVRLTADLRSYDVRCAPGSLGWTVPNGRAGPWGTQDRFVEVRFDSGADLDVLWSGLEDVPE